MQALVEQCNLLAAYRLRIPTHKGFAVTGRHTGRRNRDVAVKHLRRMAGLTAVALINHKAVILGRLLGIHAVDEQIRLAPATPQQVVLHTAASLAPHAKGPQQIVTGRAIGNRTEEKAVGIIDPVATYIVGKQRNGIKLILRQC